MMKKYHKNKTDKMSEEKLHGFIYINRSKNYGLQGKLSTYTGNGLC